MTQVKIYGMRDYLNPIKQQLSDAIHACLIEALQYLAHQLPNYNI